MNDFIESGIIAILGWEIGRWIFKKWNEKTISFPAYILEQNGEVTISIKNITPAQQKPKGDANE